MLHLTINRKNCQTNDVCNYFNTIVHRTKQMKRKENNKVVNRLNESGTFSVFFLLYSAI